MNISRNEWFLNICALERVFKFIETLLQCVIELCVIEFSWIVYVYNDLYQMKLFF